MVRETEWVGGMNRNTPWWTQALIPQNLEEEDYLDSACHVHFHAHNCVNCGRPMICSCQRCSIFQIVCAEC